MKASSTLTALGRTAMLGGVLLAVSFADGAYSQGHFADDFTRRIIEPFAETNWAPADQKRGFERMFRLYEPAQAWESPDLAAIPAEGRAVGPADE